MLSWFERFLACAALMQGLLVACVPADPEDGLARRGERRRLSTNGPRLGGTAVTERRSLAASNLRGSSRRAPSPSPTGSTSSPSVLRAPFHDDFNRQLLGSAYLATSAAWQIENGRLCARGAHNRPLWLVNRLPTNARIEFDAESASSDGDIKVEAWGDGRSRATTMSYTNASSYILVFGGWHNSLHVLARLDEHAPTRSEVRIDPDGNDPRTAPVEAGQSYHFTIERRDGCTVRFSVDEVEILSMMDSSPLAGPGHEHFAFNDWETPVCFDNLDIIPLED